MKMEKTILAIALTALILGCISQPACEQPYMDIGGRCCLDSNGNGLCDEKEATSTTLGQTTPTTPGACSIDGDCGIPEPGNMFCGDKEVLQYVTTYRCVDNECVGERNRTVVTQCGEDETCINSNCVKS